MKQFNPIWRRTHAKMAQLLKLKSLDSWDFTFEKDRKFTLNPKIIQWEFTLEKNDKAGSLVTWLKRLGLYMAAYASACIEVKSFAFNAYVVSIKSQTSVYQIQGSAKDKQNAINVHPKIFNFLRKFSKSAKKRWIDFFERWFDESYELDLPEIINQIIKYSTNDPFPHPSFISFQFYFWSFMSHKLYKYNFWVIKFFS